MTSINLKGAVPALCLAALLQLATAPVAEAKGRWYGWQLLPADGVGTGLLTAGAASQRFRVYGLVAGYSVAVLGPPIVHWARGNGLNGGKSIGLRAGCALAGGLGGFVLGLLKALKSARTNIKLWTIVGSMVGLLAAQIVDSAAFAYDDAPAGTSATSLVSARRWGLKIGWSH